MTADSKDSEHAVSMVADKDHGAKKAEASSANGTILLQQSKPASYPKVSLALEERYIDEPREVRVAVIGAGLTGIIAGSLLPAKVPGIKLTMYEKNADVGGTWFENMYPGVRCDVPAHVYQSTFEPNTQWSETFAQGGEIREYWKHVANKYQVYQHLKLSHRVDGLEWKADRSVWSVTVRDLVKGETGVDEADYVLTAIGRFNAWKLPDYPGLGDFKGVLRHASNWDPSFDAKGKKVAVIGNGASGIQLVANLQPLVSRLDHYARNKTWIAASFAGDETSIKPIPIDPALQQTFQDPAEYLKYRKATEEKYFRGFSGLLKGSEENERASEEFIQLMKQRLAKRPDFIDKLIPDFSPHCRRLTPGPGYFEAITSDTVDYVQTPIKAFTETGIETVDGQHREVDAIFCATGANVEMVPPFSIVAKGEDLGRQWREDGAYGFPYTYLGLATPGFPNLGFLLGPNSSGRAGTVPHSVEIQVTFFAKLLRKLGREGISTIQPSKRATDDFIEYSDAFFDRTVLSEDCSSWYNSGKAGSRIHGLWPGSASHQTIVAGNPRWEDWEYEYLSPSGNRFAAYLGTGVTRKELDAESDMTPYLKVPSEIDIRDLHESWHSYP